MTTLTKKPGPRMVRWFTRLVAQKKSRERWYDVENYGLH
jgi:hypothetical protein